MGDDDGGSKDGATADRAGRRSASADGDDRKQRHRDDNSGGGGQHGREKSSRSKERDRDRDRDRRKRRDRDRSRSRSRDRKRKDGGSKSRRDRDDDDEEEEERLRRRKMKDRRESKSRDRRRKRGRSSRRSKKKRRRRKRTLSSSSSSSPSSSSSSSSTTSRSSSSSSSTESGGDTKSGGKPKTRKVANARLLAKLAARGETLEEREERRAARRAARIQERFGYTAEENPFNDPNIAETFTWKKREDKVATAAPAAAAAPVPGASDSRKNKQDHIFSEIDKVRQRRKDREAHFEEMERIRAEESRMKELENYDEWARKEEEFHLQQQRQRSAIRLVEGREKPVDVLAKNLLLFGLTEEEKKNRAAVKYREKYSALDELETLEAELEEPHIFLRDLKLNELQELLADIEAFRTLEREAAVAAARDRGEAPGGGVGGANGEEDNPVLRYWDALHLVTRDEIKYVNTGGKDGQHASVVADIQKMFEGQSRSALDKMRGEIEAKVRGIIGPKFDGGGIVDTDYWQTVLDQLVVHLAKMELSEIHSKMLVRQLEKLEKRKDELAKATEGGKAATPEEAAREKAEDEAAATNAAAVPRGVEPDFGNLEEELGLTSEVDLSAAGYAWQDKYRPRKPRYFNRVKTGYDWNKYNQTHYDHDNPPPKTVQGYKFNVFYPDLIDRTKTPQYVLEPADTDEFCIIRFKAGPPYEDLAFKIINREWNRSRKHGFRCTFERGVLSLYFNFKSHWYRR